MNTITPTESLVDRALRQNGEPITEDSAALSFAARHRNNLRYDHDVGKWFTWSGKRWKLERTKLAFNWARDLARELVQDAPDKVRFISSKTSFAAGVERFAQADRAFAVTSEIWDRDPYLLGTPDGTIDLRTGKMRPPAAGDFITKCVAVVPTERATCPRWMTFLNEATAGDDALISFLQHFCGYVLTGDTREHALLFIHGPAGTGKTKFLNTVSGILDDYSRVAAMETFVMSPTDRHPTDLAMLKGARLVCASETEEGRAWAESRIKALTGGDKIAARFMRQDFFEFTPQFKLVIIGNHKPTLRNVDDAARRRFNIVPFIHKPIIPDLDLEAKLKPEWPAILRWMIDGCLLWQRNGLVRPQVVSEATDEYFSEQDSVRQWIDECCETGARGIQDTVASLFGSWTAWATRNGEKPGTTRWFSQTMTRQGFEPGRTMHGRIFLRVRVKPASEAPPYWADR